MTDFKIRRGLSCDLFKNGKVSDGLADGVVLENGCWYLCTDTAELFVGTSVEDGVALKRINEAEIHQIPVGDLVLKSDIDNVKQEVIETVVPGVEEVKTRIEEVLIPKVEKEIVPTVEELKTWVENKEFLQHIDLNGFATEMYVKNAIDSIEIPEADLTGYYTKEETTTAIADAVAKVEHPTVDLSGHALKTEVEVKADKILFTTAKFVTKAFGGFAIGEDINGLTIAQLFAKLLELSDEKPKEPDTPINPDGIVDTIIYNKLPMYSINSAGELVSEEFSIQTLSKDESLTVPESSGFYQIEENGKVIESGYHDLTVENPGIIYTIALPKDIDFSGNVTVKVYDELTSSWHETNLVLSNDFGTITSICEAFGINISHIDLDKYTLWADLSSGQGPSGKIYRFIINE